MKEREKFKQEKVEAREKKLIIWSL
jgi:hypothetical protein